MGNLTVITGPMFAGKTRSIISCIQGLPAKAQVKAYKPTVDTRYDTADIISHNGERIPAQWVDTDLNGVSLSDFIVVDEAQFLTLEAVYRIQNLLQQGASITLAGLDLDYLERPFGQMALIFSIASSVVKLTGTCAQCGGMSTRTFRKSNHKEVTLIGGSHTYEPRCYSCYHGVNLAEKQHHLQDALE